MGPPRHGKSLYTSRFIPGWFVGRFPEKRVMLTSHKVTLAEKFTRASRGDVLRFGEQVFDVRLSEASRAADRWDIAEHDGGVIALGAGGHPSGEGADLLIGDDLVSGTEAALSEVQRDKLWDWWEGEAYPRLEPNATVVLFMTRWHDDDIMARVLAQDPQRWEVLRLPALAEDNDPLGRARGEALWPERWPRHVLEDLRSRKSSFWWSAMYQGTPIPEGGGIWKSDWWKDSRYRVDAQGTYTFPDGYRCHRDAMLRFGVLDLAVSEKTSADFTAFGAFGLTPDRRLVVFEMIRERTDDALPLAQRAVKDWGLVAVWEEDEGTLLLEIRRHRRAGLPVRTFSKSKDDTSLRLPRDKVATYHEAAHMLEAKRLSLPVEGVSWRADLEAELGKIPYAANDDQADVVAVASILADRLVLSAPSDDAPERRGRAAYDPANEHPLDREERLRESGGAERRFGR